VWKSDEDVKSYVDGRCTDARTLEQCDEEFRVWKSDLDVKSYVDGRDAGARRE
jgi:hypothetical protein